MPATARTLRAVRTSPSVGEPPVERYSARRYSGRTSWSRGRSCPTTRHPARPQRDRVARPPVGHRCFERRRVGWCLILLLEPKLISHPVLSFLSSGWTERHGERIAEG